MPNNRQLQEKMCEGLEATTYNKFFSIAVGEDEGGKLPQFDYSGFDVIVFDEVFMVNIYYIKSRIRSLCLNNPDTIRILTGDTKQRLCFEEHTSCQDEETCANHCIDVICPYNTFLTICKEVGARDSEKGYMIMKITISCIYDDFLDTTKEIIPKYLVITDYIMRSEHNIAYTNIWCKTTANDNAKSMKWMRY